MDRITKAIQISVCSIGLALIFNFLFFSRQLGISVVIFAVVVLVVLGLFAWRQRELPKTWWLGLFILFFTAMVGIRDNMFLNFLNVCASLALFMLLAHQLVGTPPFLLKLRDYLMLAVVVPFRMLRRALSTVSLLGQIHSSSKHRDVWVRVLKGVVLAVPALIVFGALFAHADNAFSQFLNSIIHVTISPEAVRYAMLLCVAFVATLGYLSYIFLPKVSEPVPDKPAPTMEVESGKGTEVMVFLGLIGLLFALFIAFQITYLFGGETNIMHAGFTYAEYARHGFWELLFVAALSVVMLLGAEKYGQAEERKSLRFMVPALILVAEVVVVIISAFKRLSLYIDAYGMSDLRFYVATTIIFLFVLFVFLAVKFIWLKREQFFTFGALLAALLFLVAVNVINPDAFIARANIAQFDKMGKIDEVYMATLSMDAIAQKAELLDRMKGQDTEALQFSLMRDRDRLRYENGGWRSANWSRAQARKVLAGLGMWH